MKNEILLLLELQNKKKCLKEKPKTKTKNGKSLGRIHRSNETLSVRIQNIEQRSEDKYEKMSVYKENFLYKQRVYVGKREKRNLWKGIEDFI